MLTLCCLDLCLESSQGLSIDFDNGLSTSIFNIQLISESGIMSEEREMSLDRLVHLYFTNSYARWKLVQFLSTTQKAVDYIGGSMKAHMNIGGTFTNIVRFPTDNYCSYSLLTMNTVADFDV